MDSALSSRAASPTGAPADPASVRSLAIAKLKRAASLPRMKNGRRPHPDQQPEGASGSPFEGGSAVTRPGQERTDWFDGGRNSIGPPPVFDDDPVHHSHRQPSQTAGHSLSHSYGGGTAETTAWAEAEQVPPSLARSASVSTQGNQQPPARFQLPSLQHIQSRHLLQRSNSAAARMMAMHKLTGTPNPPLPIPSPEPTPFAQLAPPTITTLPPSPQKQQSGTGQDDHDEQRADEGELGIAPTDGRPRLRRSHTVGGGDGVERRSVVGRRMMMRLGNRVATPSPSPSPSVSAQSLASSRSAASSRGPSTVLTPSQPAANDDEQAQGQFEDDDGQEASYQPSHSAHSPGPISANTFGHPHTPQTARQPDLDKESDENISGKTEPHQSTEEDPVEDLLPASSPGDRQVEGDYAPIPAFHDSEPFPSSHPRLSSASSASTHSVPSSTDHGFLGPGDHTDSFEFAAHLRRTNSGRTVRSISPFPPGHPSMSSTEAEHRQSAPPPLPSSPLLAHRSGDALAPHSTSLSAFPPQQSSLDGQSAFSDTEPTSAGDRTPPRQTTRSFDSTSASVTPSAFSVASTASPGSIPILPPSEDGHGARPFGSAAAQGERGVSTSSFPASVSGGEMLGRATGDWSAAPADQQDLHRDTEDDRSE